MRRLLIAALALAACGGQAPAAPPAPAGTLYLAGRDPGTATVVDAASGKVTEHRVRELSGGDPPYMLAFTGGRLVTFSLGRTSSLSPALTDPRSLGEAWFFVPSATPGRVWTVQLKHGEPATRIHFRSVREVAVDGRVTARGKAPPGWPLGAAGGGLVLQHGRGLWLWDPFSGRERRLPGMFPLGFHGDLVASCAPRCQALHLTNARTGHRALVRGRHFIDSYEGAFSPDGRLLAVPAREHGRIVLVDVVRRRARLLPRARLARDYQLLSWSSSGWLYYNAGRGRLGAWRPGVRARLLSAKVGPFVDMVSD